MVIKNVVQVGASGRLGKSVLQRLLSSDFNVKVLRRLGSKSTFCESATVIDADFSSKESLVTALNGVDAIVSTIANFAVPSQRPIIDAAIEAGVQRFIPSDFGSSLGHPAGRNLDPLADKIKIQDYLIEKSKTTSLTWTSMANNVFLDLGLKTGFLLAASDGKLNLVGTGDDKFSATTLDTISESVVAVLRHPEETKNRTVFIDDVKVSQNQILAYAKQVAPEKQWDVQHLDIDAAVADAQKKWDNGVINLFTAVPFLLKLAVVKDQGGYYEKTDNELLGVKPKGEQCVVDILTELLK